MKKKGKVTAIDKNIITITVNSSEGCNGCTACSSGKNRCETFEIETTTSFTIGEDVEIELPESFFIKSAFILYIFPLILFFSGYYIAFLLKLQDGMKILLSFMFLAVGIPLLYYIDKYYNKKSLIKNCKIISLNKKEE